MLEMIDKDDKINRLYLKSKPTFKTASKALSKLAGHVYSIILEVFIAVKTFLKILKSLRHYAPPNLSKYIISQLKLRVPHWGVRST